MDDRQLLADFVRNRSEDTFGQLVRRHADWVYSTCLRRLRDRHLAEDAAQMTFLALARKASSLQKLPTLAPWLYQAAKFSALNIQRSERRRLAHEKELAAMKSKAMNRLIP